MSKRYTIYNLETGLCSSGVVFLLAIGMMILIKPEPYLVFLSFSAWIGGIAGFLMIIFTCVSSGDCRSLSKTMQDYGGMIYIIGILFLATSIITILLTTVIPTPYTNLLLPLLAIHIGWASSLLPWNITYIKCVEPRTRQIQQPININFLAIYLIVIAMITAVLIIIKFITYTFL